MVERRLLGGLILCLVLGTAAGSDNGPPATTVIGTLPQADWQSLSPQQKAILAPLAGEWDKMGNVRRKKWLGIAEIYPRKSPAQQQRIQDRMRKWTSLTPTQREKIRDRYKDFKQLPPEQKRVLLQKWKAYSSLSAEEKKRLRQHGKSADLLKQSQEPMPPPLPALDGAPTATPAPNAPPADSRAPQ